MSIPNHVAIIMDGNGRWANNLNLPRVYGHRMGVESVRNAVNFSICKKINQLTLFAFSTENFNRPVHEVNFIINLFYRVLREELSSLKQRNVKLNFIGKLEDLPAKVYKLIKLSMQETAANTGLLLTIAINYSGRWHITKTIQTIFADIGKEKNAKTEINEALIDDYIKQDLYSDPDLFIRTSGESRISNFMLWSLAYTELYFTSVHWPDFDDKEFAAAINSFASRERRYGLITEEA